MDEVGRFDATKGPRIVGPRDGVSVDLGSISARFMVWGEESGGGSSLVKVDMDRVQDLCEEHGLRFPPLVM
jgi:hypothetical protein